MFGYNSITKGPWTVITYHFPPRVQETDSKGWLGALLTCTGLMYSGAVAAVVLMFLYYTGDFTGQCKLHEFFISFNMLVCIALSVISIMPKVQVMLNRNLIRGSQIITLELQRGSKISRNKVNL